MWTRAVEEGGGSFETSVPQVTGTQGAHCVANRDPVDMGIPIFLWVPRVTSRPLSIACGPLLASILLASTVQMFGSWDS